MVGQYDHTVDKKTVIEAQKLVIGLPSTLTNNPTYPIHFDDLEQTDRGCFDSVLTYCIEIINNQIQATKQANQNYTKIRDGLAALLPENNVFGAGMNREKILKNIYNSSRRTN